MAIACYFVALILRFGGRIEPRYLEWQFVAAPVIGVAYFACASAFRLHRRDWRYASMPDLIALFASATSATGVVLLADLLVFPTDHPLPLSVVPVGGAMTFLAVAALRFARHLRRFVESGLFPQGSVGVLIVGAGQTGQLLAGELLRNREWNYQPTCFVDADPTMKGIRVHGVPVRGGYADIPGLVKAYNASVVAIAVPEASAAQLRQIVDICQPLPVRMLIVPAFSDILCGKDPQIQLREVRIEDLLGREPVKVDLEACRSYLAGNTVLVTGAAGSIGSELSRQVLRLGAAKLILFDNNETAVHDLNLDLSRCANGTELVPIVGSVTDAHKIDTVFRYHLPQVVFHAAAYKHVPLMEEFPEEAARVNVLGTHIVAVAAQRFGVSRFVLVSTDKAVNPHNVMGATKRLAELIVRSMVGSSRTVFCAVRFGNVLGSRGSVVPIFTRQIEQGGPITVTHPGMTRFFMTIPEAASLVIEAASAAVSGEVFVLDMGEQMRILDLAEKMVRLRGLRLGVDIGIEYTGLRPGEKLTEELITDSETVGRTIHPKVLRVQGNGAVPDVLGAVSDLQRLLALGSPDQIREAIFAAVRSERHVPEHLLAPEASPTVSQMAQAG